MAIYGGSNRVCMRAYMAIYGGSPIGRVGKGFPVIPFLSLLRGRELPSLRSFPFLSPVPFPVRGREEIPYPVPQRSKGLVNYKLNLLADAKIYLIFYISRLEPVDFKILL